MVGPFSRGSDLSFLSATSDVLYSPLQLHFSTVDERRPYRAPGPVPAGATRPSPHPRRITPSSRGSPRKTGPAAPRPSLGEIRNTAMKCHGAVLRAPHAYVASQPHRRRRRRTLFSPHNTSHDTISPERSSRVLHNRCGGGIIDLCRTLVVGGTNYAQVAVRPSSAQGSGAAVTPPHDAHVGEVVTTVDLMWWSSSPPRRHARGVSCPFWGPVSLTEVWSVPVLPAKESVTPWL